MWNLPPPPGFTGLDVNRPMRFYERHLPHWRQEGATYFVTFRQADALPQAKLRELAALRRQWDAKVGQSTALSEDNVRQSSIPSYDHTRQSGALSYGERV